VSLTQEGTKLLAGTRRGCYDGRLRGRGHWFEEVDDSIRFVQKGCVPDGHGNKTEPTNLSPSIT
jgi:hypothetical protein